MADKKISELVQFVGVPALDDVFPFVDTSASETKKIEWPDLEAAIDHGSIAGIADDDHDFYAMLAGRSGGQTLIGGLDASDDLVLNSTAHGTKGVITCQDEMFVRPSLIDYAEVVEPIGLSAAAQTIDYEDGQVVTATLAEAMTTFTFSNPPAAGYAGAFTLILTQDVAGARDVTWPISVVWPGGVAPTLTPAANAIDIFAFLTVDGGLSWYGFEGGLNFS